MAKEKMKRAIAKKIEPKQTYQAPRKKAVPLGKRITHASEGLSVAGLAGLGVQSAMHNALHRHMYEHDGIYKRSYDAHLKARKNAVNRLAKKSKLSVSKFLDTFSKNPAAKVAKGAAKVASKVK